MILDTAFGAENNKDNSENNTAVGDKRHPETYQKKGKKARWWGWVWSGKMGVDEPDDGTVLIPFPNKLISFWMSNKTATLQITTNVIQIQKNAIRKLVKL